MSDERSALGHGEIGLESAPPRSSSRSSGIDGDSISQAVLSARSDDDEMPIVSMFKLKKRRVSRKAKGGFGVRVENRVAEDDSGEMGDTLATLKKKLKGPKRGKDGVGGSGENGSLMGDARLDDETENRSKRLRLGSVKKDVKGGLAGVVDGSDHSSDVSSGDSLFTFIQKAHSGSVRRSRSAAKQQKPVDRVHHQGIEDGLSIAGINSSFDGVRKPGVARRRGRKSRSSTSQATKVEGMVSELGDRNPVDETLENLCSTSMSLACKSRGGAQKKSSVKLGKDTKISMEGSNSRLLKESPSVSGIEGKVEGARLDSDCDAIRSSEGNIENSELSGLQSYGSLGINNKLIQTCNVDPPLNEEEHKLEDGLKPCTNDKKIHLKCEATLTNVPIWTDVTGRIKPSCDKENIAETPGTKPLSLKDVINEPLEFSCPTLFRDSCPGEGLEVSEESRRPAKLFVQSFDVLPQVKPVIHLTREKVMPCLNDCHSNDHYEGPLIGTNVDVDCPDPTLDTELFSLHENRISDNNAGCDGDLLPYSLSVKESSGSLNQSAMISAVAVQMCSNSCFDDGFKENLSGPQGLSAADVGEKQEEIQNNSDVLDQFPLNDPLPGSGVSFGHLTMEEKLGINDGLSETARVNLSLATSAAAKLSASAFPSNCEAFPTGGNSVEQSVEGAPLMNQCSHDASNEQFSSPDQLIKRDNGATYPQSNMVDLVETHLTATASVSEIDDADQQSTLPRVMRSVKKRRHGDMAYEGDVDWEVLIHEQGLFANTCLVDGDRPPRMSGKSDSHLNILVEAADVSTSAVAAGLRVSAAGPLEKIIFKDIFKRKGGLQEYLDCRLVLLFSFYCKIHRFYR